MSSSSFDPKQLVSKADAENNADIPAAVFVVCGTSRILHLFIW